MPDERHAVTTVPKRSEFSELLVSIGDGTLESDLSDIVIALTSKLREMGEHGGKPKGSVTLKIKFVYDRGTFDVDSDVKTTEPQIVRPRTLMYAARDGGLSRNNPQQTDAFRDEPVDDRPARDIPLSVAR